MIATVNVPIAYLKRKKVGIQFEKHCRRRLRVKRVSGGGMFT